MPQPIVLRDIYVLSRKETLIAELANRITEIAAQSIRELVQKSLIHLAPWAREQFFIASNDGEEREKIFL